MDLLQSILENKLAEPTPQRKYLVERNPHKQEPKAPVYNLKKDQMIPVKPNVPPTFLETQPQIIYKLPQIQIRLPTKVKEEKIPFEPPIKYKRPQFQIRLPSKAVDEKEESVVEEILEEHVHIKVAYKRPIFNLKLREKQEELPTTFTVPLLLNNTLPLFELNTLDVPEVAVSTRTFKLRKFKQSESVKVDELESMSYSIPTKSDLAVLFVFFDYSGSARILINYLYMIEKMKLSNIPVFTMELVINGKRPKISDAFHVYASSYLFQKEHLIRLLEKKIPDTFTKLVCLDADLIFSSPDWYDMLSEKLDTCNVIQPFYHAHWLDITYKEVEKKAVACTCLKDKSKGFWSDAKRQYHPGFGWAFTRSWYKAAGFYDLAIVGCGDSIFGYSISKIDFLTEKIKLYRKTRDEWANGIPNIILGFFDVDIYHLYHGPLTKRQYNSRDEPFEQIDDVSTIIEYNADGVIELTRPDLNQAMFDMWMARDDDGI